MAVHRHLGGFGRSRNRIDRDTADALIEKQAIELGSIMFEGFNPTPKGIEIIRNYVTGKISLTELMAFAKQKYPPESRD